MRKILQVFILLLLLGGQSVFAQKNISTLNDKAYEAYEKGEKLYQEKQYNEALKWLKISYLEDSSKEVALDVGLIYEELKDYDNAIKWYQTSDKLGNASGAYNLALLYKNKYKDFDKAIVWYKKAISKGHILAIKNLGYLYRTEKHDNLLGSAYMIGLIEKKYTKKQVINYLKTKLKIDEATIKKAYELQKTLIPDPYYDKEFETQTSAPKKSKKSRR